MKRGVLAVVGTLATALAVAIADFVFEILVFAVLGCYMFMLLPIFGGLLGGFPVGFMQWLVLRQKFPRSGAWVWATTLGFVASWTLAMTLFVIATTEKVSGNLALFLVFAIPTPTIGIAQAFVLRRWTSRTWLWIVANTIAWSGARRDRSE